MKRHFQAVLSAGALTATGLVVLVPAGPALADTPGAPDNVLVSTAPDGSPANDMSDRPQISGDGRFITFDSFATNLVDGVSARERRVYRKDMLTGVTEPVSANNSGVIANSWSSFSYPTDDGMEVAFVSNATALALPAKATTRAVYVRKFATARTELVSVSTTGVAANAAASRPMITGDGRFVAFNSPASNLVSQGGNGQEQVYVRDRLLGTTTLVSVAMDGGLGDKLNYRGMVSADGRYVTWASKSTNLVPGPARSGESIYTRDLLTGVTTRVSVRLDGEPGGGSRPYMTPDGEYVGFNSYDIITPGDTPGSSDTFVWTRTTGTFDRLGESGAQEEDVVEGDSLRVFLSNDARYAIWNSFANNLVPNDSNPAGDVFIRDRQTSTTTLLSLSWFGGAADAQSFRPVFSDDATRVAYLSRARNLVQNDASTDWQVYAMTASTVTSAGLDTTAPSFSGAQPTAGSTVMTTSPVQLSGTLSDDRAVDRAYVQIRDTAAGKWRQADGSWGPTAVRLPVVLDNRYGQSSGWSYNVSLSPGQYAFQTIGYDVSKNHSTLTPLVRFTGSDTPPDTIPPSTTVAGPANNTTTFSPVTFTGTASDDIGVDHGFVSIRDNATMLWLKADGTWGSSITRLPTTLDSPGALNTGWSYTAALPDGTYGWEAGSYDAAGNVSNRPFNKVVVNSLGPDTTPATATVSAPTHNSTVTSPVSLMGTAADDRGVTRVFVQVRDVGTGLWLRPDGSWGVGAVRLAATLSSPGGTSTDWSYSVSLSPGTYTFDVTALDAANNTPTKPVTRFTVTS